jgi:hypothetical protein
MAYSFEPGSAEVNKPKQLPIDHHGYGGTPVARICLMAVDPLTQSLLVGPDELYIHNITIRA